MSNQITAVLTTIAGGNDAFEAVCRMLAGMVALIVLGVAIALFVSTVMVYAREFLIAIGIIIGALVLGGLTTRFFWEYLVPMWRSVFG